MLARERLGLEANRGLDVAPLGVDRVQLQRDRAGALAVLGQQQLQPGVGAVEAPGGVQPRAEPEADRRLVEAARVDARDVHQRAQPDLARARQRTQALAHEPAVLAHQRHDVGDRRQRDQVEVLVGERRVLARGGQQRLREPVGDAGGAQMRARIAVQARVDERRGRQRAVGARAVVVGDHDVHPGRARGGDLLDRGDRAVDGDQQVGAARGKALDRGEGEPVAVVDPARQVPVDVRAERAQRAHEDRGRADAVHVVVAVHGDARAAAGVAEDPLRRLGQPRPGRERMQVGGGEERARRLRLPEPAPNQHLGEHVRAPERGRERRGGGELIRGDRQPGVHDPAG